jgi:hypothetical protein
MTTLEIILIIVTIHLTGAHIMNYISVAVGCYLMDFEDLTQMLLWEILLPYALIVRLIKTIKKGIKNVRA